MKPIEFFKLQAKNLHKDFKTQTSKYDPMLEEDVYGYTPKFFDVGELFFDYEVNEKDFSLMKAQHLIAKLAGFEKWTVLDKASEVELELAKLLFENRHKISPEEWEDYKRDVEWDNEATYQPEFWLEVFIKVFAKEEGHQSFYPDYRLSQAPQRLVSPSKVGKVKIQEPDELINYLPLNRANSLKFIKTAESAFETVIERMKPLHAKETRKLWSAEQYINFLFSKMINLPIMRNHALGLVESLLFPHVQRLAAKADEMATKPN